MPFEAVAECDLKQEDWDEIATDLSTTKEQKKQADIQRLKYRIAALKSAQEMELAPVAQIMLDINEEHDTTLLDQPDLAISPSCGDNRSFEFATSVRTARGECHSCSAMCCPESVCGRVGNMVVLNEIKNNYGIEFTNSQFGCVSVWSNFLFRPSSIKLCAGTLLASSHLVS